MTHHHYTSLAVRPPVFLATIAVVSLLVSGCDDGGEAGVPSTSPDLELPAPSWFPETTPTTSSTTTPEEPADVCGLVATLDLAPQAFWPLDNAGGTVADVSGHGWHAESAGVTLAPGVGGDVQCPATRFHGSLDSLISVQDFHMSSAASVSLWVQTESAAMAGLWSLAAGGASGNDFLVFLADYGEVCPFFGNGPTDYCAPGAVDDGAWHHLVTTFGGEVVSTYIDGVLAMTGPETQGHQIGSPGVVFFGQEQDCMGGCLDEGQSLNGVLDEVAVFDRVLDPVEVQALYEIHRTP